MRSDSLMRLTKRREGSSAGASNLVYASDWTHSLLQGLNETLPATGRTAGIALLEHWPGVRAAHYLVFEPTQTAGVVSLKLTDVVQRFVCGVLVSQLPDEA